MNKYLIIIIIILLGGIGISIHKNKVLNEKYNISIENVKTYDSMLSSSKNENRVLKLTIEQLNYFNDSVLNKMNKIREQLDIKDKNIQQLQYELKTVIKPDTVRTQDTIFLSESFVLDTIIGDEWYKNRLYLKYPNIISSTPEFTLESYVFISSQKELINPPKKSKIGRFFQKIFGKKHTIIKVDTKELNPYVTNKDNRYIQIIK